MKITDKQIFQQAIIAHQEGKLKDAEASYKKLIELKPDYISAHINYSILLTELNRLKEAEISCKKAIELQPDNALAYNSLGNIQKKLNKIEDAEVSYKKSIGFNSKLYETYNNLAAVQQALCKFEQALLSLKSKIKIKPDIAQDHNDLGILLSRFGRFEESKLSYKKAIKIKPEYAEAHNNLGTAFQIENKLEEAEECFRKAIKFDKNLTQVLINLGNTLIERGKIEEAKLNYKKAIELKSDFVEAHFSLSIVKKYTEEDEQFVQMKNLYLDKNLLLELRCKICFALGKASEDLNQIEKSFIYYSEGNKLRKKIISDGTIKDTQLFKKLKNLYLSVRSKLRKKLISYGIIQDIQLFDQLKKTYSKLKENHLETINFLNQPMPIFIVGMPRSGSTLVEQIISSHSEVTGAGELSYINQFGDSIAQGKSLINNEILTSFRKNYLEKLEKLSNGKSIIIDKTLFNFQYIGLIRSAFPDSKIVHVKRNSIATCWSCYKHNFFSKKNYLYTYDLSDLINYYNQYQNLMRFWNEKYSNQIYNINYETLTINQEEETKKLIQYLGINWQEDCLFPQNNKRNVQSASSQQVRQKIYKGSSQKWKIFEPYLNNIFNKLDD